MPAAHQIFLRQSHQPPCALIDTQELDVEAVLEFARHLILNASQMRIQASLDQRQRLQAVLFPEGLTYADGAIGTAVTCPIFSYLDVVPGAVYGLVSPTGFEPVLPP
jgi:serine phosphatase RsbU (regulator of sigma subunit)